MKRLFKKLTKKTILAILALAVIGIPLIYLTILNSKPVSAWFNENWLYRKAITITVTTNSSDITDLETLVTLDTATPIAAGKMQSSCQDLRFTSQGGKILPYYIDSGCNGASTKVWVMVDLVPKNTTTYTMYMYYGNPGAPAASDSNKFRLFNGLVGYWTMNESSSPSIDSSVNSNGGTWNGNVAAAAGKYGNGTTYDGNGDYTSVTAGTGSALDITGNQITLSVWIKETSVGNSRYANIISRAGDAATPYYELYSGSSQNLYLFSINTGSLSSLSSTTAAVASQWVHLAGVYDGSTMKIYINGNLDATKTGVSGNITSTANALQFGVRLGNDKYFNGQMDEMRVYNRALSASEISQLYSSPGNIASNATTTAKPSTSFATEEKGPGPVAYWKFDDGQGTTAQDSSSSNNDGTLSGTTKPTWQTEDQCVAGKCLYFDGSSSYVDAGTGSAFNISGDLTLSSWFRTSDNGNLTTLMNKGTTSDWLYAFYKDTDNKLYCKIYQAASGTAFLQANSSGTVNDGKWHHGSCAVSGTTLTVYLDGVSVGSSSSTSGSRDTTSAGGFSIGQFNWTTTYNWKGFIDEPKVYPYARTLAQIKTDYLAGKANAESKSGTGAALGTKPQIFMSDGLVGYWKMDETAGNAVDSSGNSNTGTWSGTGSHYPAGKFGNGGGFNGTDDYVDMGSPSTLNFGTGDFSISAWIKTSTTGVYQDILDKRSLDANTGYLIGVGNDNLIRAFLKDGTTPITTKSSSTVTNGSWHHIVATFNRSGNSTVYVDGSQNGTPQSITGVTNSISNTGNARIGYRYPSSAWTYFNGSIDDVRVYNRALSPKEVSDLYNWAPGPVGYWNFEEGMGTAVNDHSGYSNNGAWNGTGVKHWDIGKYGTGGKFNGSDDYVSVANTISGIQTVSFWVNPTSTTANMVNINTTSPSYISASSGTISATGFTSPTYYVNGVQTASPTLVANTWQHIAVTGSGTTITVATPTGGTPTGTERITNGGMEGTYSGGLAPNWSVGSMTPTESATAHTGSKAQQVNAVNQTNEWLHGTLTSNMLANTYYLVSAWVRSDTASTGISISDGYAGSWAAPSATLPSTNTWYKYTEIVRPASTTSNFYLYDFTNSANVIFDDVSALELTLSSLFSNLYTLPPNVTAQVGATITPGTQAGVVVNLDSSSSPANFIIGYYDNNTGKALLEKVVAGTRTTLINTTTAYSAGAVIKVVNTGSSYQLWYNGTQVGATQSVTDTGIINNTLHGLFSTDATNTFTNLTLTSSLSGATLQFGRANGTSLNGKIDDVRIYNYALTGKQIVADMLGSQETVTAGSGNTSQTKPAAPVAYWKFEEGQGITANNSGSGGAGLNGTLTSMSSPATTTSGWNNAGRFNKALNFDGSNDYVATPSDVSALKITSDITLSAWINLVNTSSTHDIICKYTGTASTSAYCLTVNSSGNLVMYVVNATGPAIVTTTGSTTLTANSWYHVVGVFSSANSVKLYVNGILDKTNTTSIPTTLQNPVTILDIGAENAGSNPFTGSIDEAKIYNYALTADEIKVDMNAGASLNFATGSLETNDNPVAYWKMDESSTTPLKNSGSCGTNCDLTSNTGSMTTGKINGALQLASTQVASCTDATCGGTSGLDLDSSSVTGFTEEAWIYPTGALNQTRFIINKYVGPGQGYILYLASATLTAYFGNSGCTNNSSSVSGGTVVLNKWQHVAVTLSAANPGTATLYLNGVSVGTPTTGNYYCNTTGNFNIGFNDSSYSFVGKIDEVKIYKYAKSATQIQADAMTGKYTPSFEGAPIGEWNFEEGKDNTCNGGVNDVCDTSGSSNDGAWNGTGVKHWDVGKVGTAGKFNGTDDYINVGSVGNYTDTFTMSVWFKTSGTGLYGLLSRWEVGGASIRQWLFRLNAGQLQFYDSNATASTRGSGLNDNKWHQATVVINSANSSIYIDGALSGTTFSPTITTQTINTLIGAYYNADTTSSLTGFYTGSIDGVRIYNYARTAAQVAWDYNRGAPVGWWKFNECQGTVANDSSGNKNTGTITIGTGAGTGHIDSAGTCTTSGTAWYNGVSGKRNYSLSFDGIDDKVTVATTISGVQSVSFWVKPATNADSFMDLDGGTHYIAASSGTVSATGFSTPTIYVNGISGGTVTGGTWNHVVVITATAFNTTSSFTLGYKSAATADYLNGQIDDVKIFNYALTATQVKTEYTGGAINYGPSTGAP